MSRWKWTDVPDFGMIGGGPSDVGANAGASTGVSITAHASTNTKNATWTELIATTAHETTWVVVSLMDVGTAATGYMVDIGIGASTAEQALIPNLYTRSTTVAQTIPFVYSLPIAVPKGSRLSARCQSATSAATVKVGIQCISSPITGQHGLRRVEGFGQNLTVTQMTLLNDSGATPHTDSTWTEITAATTFAWSWLCLAAYNGSDTATAAILSQLLDIAVGAGGAEVAIVNDLSFVASTGTDTAVPGTYCLPCAIASGSRVAVRQRESTGTTGDRRLNAGLWGVG
jgi:hypothetical protein